MRTQFELWLVNYKELKKSKAQKIVETIDTISDESVLNGTLESGLFLCNDFLDFAKKRLKIFRVKQVNQTEKRLLNFLGTFIRLRIIPSFHMKNPTIL
jgi:hypothetical protein